MSGRFVRASKYRHVYGQPTKKELCYDNVRVTTNAWDSNLIKVNPLYLSVNWNASGGGAFAVIPLSERGKAPDQVPLFRGHTAAVLDTDWNPFDDHVLASGSDDGKVGIWRVPENYTIFTEPGEAITDIAPVAKLSGHTRKVGHVLFHPVANNVLASSSGDYSVKLWDIEAGKAQTSLKHTDIVVSMSFNYIGSLIATTSRDKKIRIWDPRTETVVVEGAGHAGAKNQRVAWLGETDRIVTTGFSRMSERQVGIWDTTNIKNGPIGDFIALDSSAGICMPYYDASTKMLFLAGKGDGNIRYYEYENDELFELSEYKSGEPQRGIAFMPKRGVSVHENEVVRAYKTCNDNLIEPIQFFVPRRAETFQNDIFPDCPSGEPALTASEWFGGKDSAPKLLSLESVYDGVGPVIVDGKILTSTAALAPVPAATPSPAPTPVKADTPAPEPVSYKSPEKSIDQALATPAVDDLLTKASNSDDAPVPVSQAEEESSWDKELEPTPAPIPAVVVAPVEAAAAAPAEVPVAVSAPEPVAEPTPTPKGPASVVATKLETLHNNFSEAKLKLDAYESRFEELITLTSKELASRDARIDSLEKELSKLKDLIISFTTEVNGVKDSTAEPEGATEAATEAAEVDE
ncbi:hypothetical protein V1512DRAFT_14611 [Lipomyces arxii]|uniref:uncharacterized protein n=1 Tax=Lipomyces arxii TaxID=56418 RepID=UPI0034CD702B